MVYKDRKILEMNNKVLEMDRRVMDLQELAGEKQEVIRGRDRVIEVSDIQICVLYMPTYLFVIIDTFDFQGYDDCEMYVEMWKFNAHFELQSKVSPTKECFRCCCSIFFFSLFLDSCLVGLQPCLVYFSIFSFQSTRSSQR